MITGRCFFVHPGGDDPRLFSLLCAGHFYCEHGSRPGDIIFFDWDSGGQDGRADHVGIVERVENGRVYTVEGNSDNDTCRQKSYPIGYYEIYGYGTPAY